MNQHRKIKVRNTPRWLLDQDRKRSDKAQQKDVEQIRGGNDTKRLMVGTLEHLREHCRIRTIRASSEDKISLTRNGQLELRSHL